MVTVRETIGKFILCALQIGSGASLGLEGPTVQVCAGVSNMLARLVRLGPKNTRRMTSVGMAAGIAAAFNAPIAAVTFTLEELIGDLDQTMLSGVIVAAALAAVVEHSILGSNPVFHVQANYTLTNASSLVWYALLGLLAAIVSVASPIRCWAFVPGSGGSPACLAGSSPPSAEQPREPWRSSRWRSSTSTASPAIRIRPSPSRSPAR
jgi:CIC family chloride channel protein